MTPKLQLLQGDALAVLKTLPSDSVHCVVTSPPYWGLRDYSVIGQLGLEPTLDAYLDRLMAVFEEVRRVLHPSGVVFVNCGDTYAGGGRGGNPDDSPFRKQATNAGSMVAPSNSDLPAKNRCLVPFRLALRLQAAGWWIRDVIAWTKSSPMPECLAPSTQVFIRRNGWVSRLTLGDVAKLDALPEILTPTGWQAIKRLWKTIKPAMAIQVSSVERIVCSPDHRFPISSDRRRERTRLETAHNIRHVGYADYFLYQPIQKWLVPQLTEWMGRKLDWTLGYLLGVYAAEGGREARGYGVKLTIGWHEDQFAERIRNVANALGLQTSEARDGNSRNICIRTEWFGRTVDFFAPGKCKVKALGIELILNCPEEFRSAMLQGYVDGDGSRRRDGWSAVSASERLRNDIATLASSLGIVTSKGDYSPEDKRTKKRYPHHAIWTPYSNRRKPKAGMDGTYQVHPRSRLMLNREIKMIDIEVEGGLFLIGDGLITHNSVQDRCTQAWEPILMLTKSANYFWDAEAIKEPQAQGTFDRFGNGNAARKTTTKAINCVEGEVRSNASFKDATPEAIIGGRNCRNVWSIGPEPFTDSVPGPDGKPVSHFAAFPSALPRKCILAATSAKGVCPECGEPWVREVERERGIAKECPSTVESHLARGGSGVPIGTVGKAGSSRIEGTTRTLGWRVGCDCNAGNAVPATVFDPFLGTGTTCAVALELGRNAIGIELNPVYCELAMRRFVAVTPGLQLA